MDQVTVLTCAVTGNLTRPEQSPHLPITPAQIAEDSLAAAEAGAAAVHIHVRDPQTGAPSMELDLYGQVVQTIRRHNPDVIINLTTGPGGRFVPSDEDPRLAGPGTTLLPPARRVEHIAALQPDICSLDLNTMNSGEQVVMNTPRNVARMARLIREAGVVPELECFDSGDLVLARKLMGDGVLQAPGLFTLVHGVHYAMPFSPAALAYAQSLLPAGASWSAFAIGRQAFQAVAQAFLLGGNVRIGLEDTVYLERGVLARSNAELVTKARRIVEDLGGRLASAAQARAIWQLPPSNKR
ncbi:BKACE family enzyme [Azohydromonas lata]|uniref:3-keto-5-aminohexanoate cleavage protein n=1 Tax=Azohydromonas lata TaxID=45677 RepID=A0ABU5IHE2_9BURK|nr:3-keto-5-aminohexanoate cleavage protein [Azohydromonas lata]MDZ5458025.1 3-keto-5-aminohexanoate cleavage protein [Azohydromonas lata]